MMVVWFCAVYLSVGGGVEVFRCSICDVGMVLCCMSEMFRCSICDVGMVLCCM